MQHEPSAHFRKIDLGSDRKFGLVFGSVFLVIGVWPVVFHGGSLRPWALVIAVVFLAVALLAPHLLAPLNRAWFRLGLVLNAIVSPILMAVLFFGAMVPFALFLRRKDLLRRQFQPQMESYWILRDPPGPAPDSMNKQF